MQINKPNRQPYLPLTLAFTVVFGILLGILISTISSNKKQISRSGAYNKIDDIMAYIRVKYVDTVNQEQLMTTTIDKMLSGLDPHSVYIPPKDIEGVNEQLEGNFDGVGIEFRLLQDTINVITAIPGGPAETVGIKSGDRIVKINDTLVAGIKLKNEDVMHKLRGIKDTKVKVSILRKGSGSLLNFVITRGTIPLYSVDASYMIDAQTGYIKINRFSSTTHSEFVSKLRDLNNKGMKALVIDLRQNPGGYLQAATAIADELLAGEKMIVYTKGKSYEKQEYLSGKPGMFETGKLCILIDQGSASASEILAGAVQDWDRGTIIGRTSFGKGLVQEQFELADGSGLRLTVARYYTPSGRCIQRPYDKGLDAYYGEVYERYMKGEFMHEDTSKTGDTTVYYTNNHKRVYGGGGIRPDVFVPLDTSVDLPSLIEVRSLIPEFVYSNYSNYAASVNAFKSVAEFNAGYTVSEAVFNDYKQYLSTMKMKFDDAKMSKAAPRIKQLITCYFAKQRWGNDGFYYLLNQSDNVLAKAKEVLPK